MSLSKSVSKLCSRHVADTAPDERDATRMVTGGATSAAAAAGGAINVATGGATSAVTGVAASGAATGVAANSETEVKASLSFHKFPDPTKEPELLKKWINCIPRDH